MDVIEDAKKLVLEKNNLTDAYLRAVAWRGSEIMGVSAQSNTILSRGRLLAVAKLFRSAQRLKGIRLDLAEIAAPIRAPRLRAPGRRTCVTRTISKHRAERKGYADAMMLDWEGRVAECTGARYLHRGMQIYTPIRPIASSTASPGAL